MFQKLRRWWNNRNLRATYGERIGGIECAFEQVKIITELAVVRQFLPEAVQRFDYLLNNGVILGPYITEGNHLAMTPVGAFTEKPNKQYLGLHWIWRGDKDIPMDNHQRLIKRTPWAMYAPEIHCVFLNGDHQETDRFCGSILLHEIGHAMLAQEEGRAHYRPTFYEIRSTLEEELVMWKFDCHLALLLGGDEFHAEMEAAIARVLQRIAGGTPPTTFMVESGAPLDLCYGPIKGNLATSRRDSCFTVYCNLIALSRIFMPTIAHELQLLVMTWPYGERLEEEKRIFDDYQKQAMEKLANL